VTIGIDVQEFEQIVGNVPRIAVKDREQAKERREREYTFYEFERRYGTKAFDVLEFGFREGMRFVRKFQDKSPQTDISLSEIVLHYQWRKPVA